MHTVYLVPLAMTRRGRTYRVEFQGETLVPSSTNPEPDAIKALLARGLTGSM